MFFWSYLALWYYEMWFPLVFIVNAREVSWSYNFTPALFCFLLQDFEARRYIDQKVEVVVSQEYLAGKIISQDSQLFFSSFFLCLLLIPFPSHQQSGTTTNEYLTKLDEALKVCIYYHIDVVYDHFCFCLYLSQAPQILLHLFKSIGK